VIVRARPLLAVSSLVLALALGAREAHATFVIVNMDGPGEGFNDPTPAAPVGGNPGTTVGAQRLNVFTKAGQIWDALLSSPVTIFVRASFDPLPCSANSGVLGSAGPNAIESDFAGAPYAATWFTSAEANRIAGTDLEPGVDDIAAQFQSNVGTPGCLSTRSWYYGFDGNEGATGIDLLPVLLHEFGHGLGFLTLTDETNGSYYAAMPTIFDRYLMDNVSNKHWIDMTPAERVSSAINTTHLVWDGPSVTARVPQVLGKRAHVVASGALTGDFLSGQGVFSAPITLGGVTGDVVLVNDGVGTTTDGCETPFVNAATVAGHVALVDRSAACSMAQQSLNAQNAGAIAVIIINNVAGPEPQLRGAAPTVSIPVASLSQTDGNALRAALGSGTVHVTIALDPAHLAGADDSHRVEMFAPNPDQPGSSVSHFDVSAFPNLLMEPSINPDLTTNVDLTLNLFKDIGWYPGSTGVGDRPVADLGLSIAPNPSTTGGTVQFALGARRPVDVAVYDVAGRTIAHLAHGMMGPGRQTVSWARRDDADHRVGPGVYLIRLRSGSVERTVHVVLTD
jgi:PA domain-containing protein